MNEKHYLPESGQSENNSKTPNYDQTIEVQVEDIETDYTEREYQKPPGQEFQRETRNYTPRFKVYTSRGCGCGCLPFLLILLGLFALLDRLF